MARNDELIIEELHAALESMTLQFAYRTLVRRRRNLNTGGLSALEEAFEALGWDDPHFVPEGKCEDPACRKWASCGTPTPDGYKRLCYDHYSKVANPPA